MDLQTHSLCSRFWNTMAYPKSRWAVSCTPSRHACYVGLGQGGTAARNGGRVKTCMCIRCCVLLSGGAPAVVSSMTEPYSSHCPICALNAHAHPTLAVGCAQVLPKVAATQDAIMQQSSQADISLALSQPLAQGTYNYMSPMLFPLSHCCSLCPS